MGGGSMAAPLPQIQSGGPATPPSNDPYAPWRARCVQQTNAFRARLNLSQLVQRVDKETCADVDAQGDAATGKAHGGSGHCGFRAQNECPGWAGNNDHVVSECLNMMFAEGPGEPYAEHGHYINMTRPHYTGVACGFFRAANGKLWVVQNFY